MSILTICPRSTSPLPSSLLLAFLLNLLLSGSALNAADDSDQAMRLHFGEVRGEPGFYSIFNGKNLNGWDGQPGSWRVENGVIQCTGKAKARNWLIWRGFGVTDFELRLDFRYRKGNSGVQVRSADIGDWQVRGYQVEVSPSEGMGLWHHSLMSPDIEVQNTRKHLATAGQRVIIHEDGSKVIEQFAPAESIQAKYQEGEWNTMTVIARGNHLIQKINDLLFADLTDDQAGFSSERGVIALQDHGKGADVAFRNIRIKFLDTSDLAAAGKPTRTQPNIFFAISDDQSWLHAGAYGDRAIQTPAFDSVATRGALFHHAYTSSPSCTPSRGAILTGQHHWRLGKGANLHSTLSKDLATYTELLTEAGYHVGATGKGWGPGDYTDGGRTDNPAGKEYNKKKRKAGDLPAGGISNIDYLENFRTFLKAKPADAPFCFWFGSKEPHRQYEDGSWKRHGKQLADVKVPGYLPDHPDVRGDILDYYLEIEYFDKQLGRMLRMMENRGELENTLVVVTSDNGMPFPRSKTNLYDSGVRLPLAVQWQAKFPGGKAYDALVHFTDFAPTFLEAAGLKISKDMTGRSLLPLLESQEEKSIPWREHLVFGRERHTVYANRGRAYHARGIRTHDYLLIHNLRPNLWPAGEPPFYTDVDKGPSKYVFLVEEMDKAVLPFVEQTLERRPEYELYDCRKDPDQRINLADHPDYQKIQKDLAKTLAAERKQLRDPLALGQKVTWDSDPYHGGSKEKWIEGQEVDLKAYKVSRGI